MTDPVEVWRVLCSDPRVTVPEVIEALYAHAKEEGRKQGMREAAMDGFHQYRVMLSKCCGDPHFVLARDEIDKVATAMQKVYGSPKRQEELAAEAIIAAMEAK